MRLLPYLQIAALCWVAWELRQWRLAQDLSGIPELTKAVRQLALLYARYLRKYYPNVLPSRGEISPKQGEVSPSIVEMSRERFGELKYRTRMTPAEAAASYEERARKRMEEQQRAATS